MSDKKYPIITISREYGAGGRSIAKGISDRLGIPFYDRDFVKKNRGAERLFRRRHREGGREHEPCRKAHE